MRDQPLSPPTRAPGTKVVALTSQGSHKGPDVWLIQARAAGRPGRPSRNACASRTVSSPPPTPKIHQGRASLLGSGPCPPPSVLKIATAREGVRVKALTAEMIIAAEMVTANW